MNRVKRVLDAGADIVMIESEGITENVVKWNTAPVAAVINGVGTEHVVFEAADPPVFEWYIKNYGNEVNLFVDRSQILQLEGLRQDIWATSRPGGGWSIRRRLPHPRRRSSRVVGTAAPGTVRIPESSC